MGSTVSAKTLGDRLVIEINNAPYTRRQVEVYIAIKESLRKDGGTGLKIVNAKNWDVALKVFAWDMLIEQEASRLGSFQPSKKNIEKYLKIVRKRFATDVNLRNTKARLGVDERSVKRTLSTVLRTEAFRSSKDRQAAISGGEGDKKKQKPAIARWLKDLEERSVIRIYKDAMQYRIIQPTLGRKTNAL